MPSKITWVFFILAALSLFIKNKPAFAQPKEIKSIKYIMGINTYYGFIYRHAPSMGKLAQSHPLGLELYLNQRTAGKKAWHPIYRYPEVGYALGWINLRNSTLGNVIYAITYLDKPMLENRRSCLRLKIGTGLVLATHPYNTENNFQNVALSSRLSYALRGDIAWAYQMSSRIGIQTRLLLTHFSNGAFKMPNSGINIPAFSLGLNYSFKKQLVKVYPPDSLHYASNRKITLYTSGAITVKEAGLPGGKKYPGFTMLAYMNKQLNRKSALNVGIDFFRDTSLRYLINTDPNIDSLQSPDFKRAGLTLGHELLISRFSVLTQLGIYVYKPYKIDAPVYQRYFLKYAINKRLFTGVALRTHFGVADAVEWHLGVKW